VYFPDAIDHDTAPTQHEKRRRLIIGLLIVIVLTLAGAFTLSAIRKDPHWTKLSYMCPALSTAAADPLGFGASPRGTPTWDNEALWYGCVWTEGSGGPGLHSEVTRYDAGILTDPDDAAREALTDGLALNFHRIGPQTADGIFGDFGLSGRVLVRAVDNLVIEIDFSPGSTAASLSDATVRAAEQSAVDTLVAAQG
jgi:hypothetical protein